MFLPFILKTSILFLLSNLTIGLQLFPYESGALLNNISRNIPDNVAILYKTFVKDLEELSLLGIMLKNLESSHVVSEKCRQSLEYLALGLKIENENAIKFVDATGKIPPGIALGHFSFFGSFDQCLDIDYPEKENSTFHGQYCSVYLETGTKITEKILSKGFFSHSKKYIKFRWDVCLPNTCQENDIELSILNFLKEIQLDENDLKISVGKCTSRKEVVLKRNQILTLIIFAILGIILLGGTLLDIFSKIKEAFSETPHEKDTGKVFEVLLCFSMYKNGLKLFNTDTPGTNLAAINGLRFFSICWIMVGHVVFFSTTSLGNQRRGDELERVLISQPLVNTSVAVDTFFFISGLLVTYVVVNAHRKYGQVNWILFYIHRIWRLFPSLSAVVLFSFIFPLLGSGPTWHDDELNRYIDCETNWWKMLLFINNFYKIGDMCFLHGWYLSIDMQFYVVSPIILIFIIRKPKLGLLLNFTFLLVVTVIPAVLGAYAFYPPTLLMLNPTNEGFAEAQRYIDDVYFKPYCRMGPYCIGIFVGYFLTKNTAMKLSRTTKGILWCLTLACNVSVLLGTYEWSQGNSYRNAQSVLYMATNRTVWAAGLAWVIVACATGNGGIINSFLSWKTFVPLGRLTYMVYLTHLMVLIAFFGMFRQIVIFTGNVAIVISFGLICVSYFVAFLASLAVEGPFLNLEKILFKSEKKPPSNDKVHLETLGKNNEAFNMKL